MTARLRAVLKLLTDCTDYTTVEQIAEATGAGARTIHRDLETLERSLSLRGVRLERRRGYGVRLIDPLPKPVLEGLNTARVLSLSDSGQRPLMILLYLIIAADWVKLSEIAHALFVSDSTVSSDIVSLEELLPASIRVDRQKGVGIYLSADEVPVRMLFLSAFPSLVPAYILSAEENDQSKDISGEERLIRLLGIRENRNSLFRMIREAETVLGYRFSPAYRSLVYSYLYLLKRRLCKRPPLGELPSFALKIPEIYQHAARALLTADSDGLFDISSELTYEVRMLARVLASCEVAASSSDSVAEYLGDLAPEIDDVIEHTLGRLEVNGQVWLHDDRSLTNYLRMTLVAAARRIDLGIPRWRELGLQPYPGLEDTPEAAALVAQFLSGLGKTLREPAPSLVRREIQEASLALGAHVELLQARHASGIRVKILCIEGLGMSNYISALVRDLLPRDAFIDAVWSPDFEADQRPGQYDLVISSFPLQVTGTPHLVIDGDASPEEIRNQLREAVRDLPGGREGPQPESAALLPEKSQELSLPVIMSVISGFFVEERRTSENLLSQAIAALNRDDDCDTELMMKDFQRRESYGSLIFEEMNIRILHCRTEGIPDPRAGVIQTVPMEPTILVLAAPLSASPVQTHALSELVIALSDYPDFPELLAGGSRREIQARLLTLFSRKIV